MPRALAILFSLPLCLTCAGRGNIDIANSFPTGAGVGPADQASDLPRNPNEFLYSESTDKVDDIPRTTDNFNFKTVVETEILIALRFYAGADLVNIPGNAVVLFRDQAGRLLWAGVTDARGVLAGSLVLSAATGPVSLYIYKDRFGERTLTIPELTALKKLNRSLYVKKTAGTSAPLSAHTLAQQGKLSGVEASLAPAYNLTGPNLSLIDSDADGVPDSFDNFPQDPSRAFKIRVPADQYYTISFEDLFPVVGDGDYNDFTGRYGMDHVLNAQNQLVEITGSADAIAKLAGYRHRFGLVLRFPGVSATLDVHKTGSSCGTLSSTSALVSDLANINLFERTDLAFTSGVGHHTFFTLHFSQPIAQNAIDLPPYDPYVFVHNTGKDVHLIGKPALPGSANPGTPVGFRDGNGFPWAMLVPQAYKYPKEAMFIENAYPQFILWRQSLGLTNQDWYNFPVAANVIAQQPVISCAATLAVQSTIPANTEATVPVNSVLRIFFNQSIDPQTVNYQTVQLRYGSTAITGNLTVTANEIQFTPTYDLSAGVAYTVHVTSAVKSVTGDTLQNEFVSTFSTELNASAQMIRELDIYTTGPGAVFTGFGSDVYFAAAQAGFGTELWKTDGTYYGTLQVRDIYGGDLSSFPESITVLGSRVLFSAAHPTYGRELFSSDGTLFGTDLLTDHIPGLTGGNPQNYTVAGGLVFYTADDGVHGKELWKSNGTTSGMVTDLNPLGSSLPQGMAILGSVVLFTADDGTHGRELFHSDGTAAGTSLIKDLQAGAASASPQNLTVSGGKVYFTAYDPVYGNELFATDGTAAGTNLKADVYAGGSSSFPSRLIDVAGTLYFVATGENTGAELYCLAAGQAQLTKDITLGSLSTSFGEMIAYGNALVFVRNGLADGDEIWVSDCTSNGTYMIRKLNPGNVQYLTMFGGAIYFSGNDGLNGQELWKTNGTFAGTLLVRNIMPGTNSSNPSNLFAHGSRLYFRIYDPFSAFPEALWKYEP